MMVEPTSLRDLDAARSAGRSICAQDCNRFAIEILIGYVLDDRDPARRALG